MEGRHTEGDSFEENFSAIYLRMDVWWMLRAAQRGRAANLPPNTKHWPMTFRWMGDGRRYHVTSHLRERLEYWCGRKPVRCQDSHATKCHLFLFSSSSVDSATNFEGASGMAERATRWRLPRSSQGAGIWRARFLLLAMLSKRFVLGFPSDFPRENVDTAPYEVGPGRILIPCLPGPPCCPLSISICLPLTATVACDG